MIEAAESLRVKMSHEENYTELECYTKPMNMYNVPVPVPDRDLRGNATARQPQKGSSCCIKILVVATFVNFLLVLAVGAVFAYMTLTHAGRLPEASDSAVSQVQGSGAAAADTTGAPSVQGPPGPPGEAGADGIPGPQGLPGIVITLYTTK